MRPPARRRGHERARTISLVPTRTPRTPRGNIESRGGGDLVLVRAHGHPPAASRPDMLAQLLRSD